MAIIGVLAGEVSGSVSELGASGRFAQILSDAKTMEIAADRFFNYKHHGYSQLNRFHIHIHNA